MLQSKLKSIKSQVDAFLKEFFEEKKKGIGKIDKQVSDLIMDVEDITLRGGDRFRPFMVWLGAQTKQKSKIDRYLLSIMSSTELLQTFALIHDDVIDKAETRRGDPTIKPDEKAILAGDLCFTFADELLNKAGIEVKKQYDILREEVIAGEWLDVFYTINNQKLKGVDNLHDLLMKIYRYKSVSYTFLQPFMMGMACVGMSLAGAQGQAQGLPLQKILTDIGLAFQMKDDYLDLFGDERLGKKIGGDLKEGKLTIWHEKIMGTQGLSRERYNKIFGNQHQTAEDLEYIKKLIIKAGIKKEVEEEMDKLVKIAKKEIEKLANINPEAKNLLAEMAEFVVSREY